MSQQETSAHTLHSPESNISSVRLILNGQGDGAAQLMDMLTSDGHEIVGVVATTKKDKKGNVDPVRAKAVEAGIPIVNLGDVNKPESQEIMNKWGADLGVGFFLQATLKKKTYAIPEYGTINFHPSLLPRRRGRDAMNWAVRDGDDEMGASMYLMNNRIDAGPVVNQISFKNPGNKSQGALYFEHLGKFVSLARDAVTQMSVKINERKNGKKGSLGLMVQSEQEATEQPPITINDLLVDPKNMDAESIKRFMNAGGPGVHTLIKGQEYKISKPTAYEGPVKEPGKVLEDVGEPLIIETLQGIIGIESYKKSS